jgi:hypothetical protein
VSRVPLSCFRSVANVKDDIMKNLEKYSNGQVNVCGVNHFSNSNTKVGKLYSKSGDKANFNMLKKETLKTRAPSKEGSHSKSAGARSQVSQKKNSLNEKLRTKNKIPQAPKKE